ncbi:unnamed protein product [Peniophora sp. CBMAI 1063]|nr:unnamed protein product [Peniophora sp. CBMAI 1063]
MPYSHHSHSGQFCKHAVGTLEEVVQEALRQGFETYCLTEHVPRYRSEDLYPEEEGTSLQELAEQFGAFIGEAQRLKKAYASNIRILVGLETEHITVKDLDGLSEVLSRYGDQIDMVVGSVHHVNGLPIDFDKQTYETCISSIDSVTGDAPGLEQANLGRYLELYFDAQFEVLKRFHPEVVGHVDLCRLYTPTLDLRRFERAWEKLTRNVIYAVGYGALFEANAAALRKGWTASYPGHGVLELIQEHGGRLALSDDSHGPQAVGLNYARMREYLLGAGVREVWTLQHNTTPNAGGRYTQAVRVKGNWWEHRYWHESGSAVIP